MRKPDEAKKTGKSRTELMFSRRTPSFARKSCPVGMIKPGDKCSKERVNTKQLGAE